MDGPMWSPSSALPREGGQAVTMQWARCRVPSAPWGGSRKGFLEEVMSMLRSEGAGLAGLSVGGGKEGIHLAEGQSDSHRDPKASGTLDI